MSIVDIIVIRFYWQRKYFVSSAVLWVATNWFFLYMAIKCVWRLLCATVRANVLALLSYLKKKKKKVEVLSYTTFFMKAILPLQNFATCFMISAVVFRRRYFTEYFVVPCLMMTVLVETCSDVLQKQDFFYKSTLLIVSGINELKWQYTEL
jgi:hypothetical protein